MRISELKEGRVECRVVEWRVVESRASYACCTFGSRLKLHSSRLVLCQAQQSAMSR